MYSACSIPYAWWIIGAEFSRWPTRWKRTNWDAHFRKTVCALPRLVIIFCETNLKQERKRIICAIRWSFVCVLQLRGRHLKAVRCACNDTLHTSPPLLLAYPSPLSISPLFSEIPTINHSSWKRKKKKKKKKSSGAFQRYERVYSALYKTAYGMLTLRKIDDQRRWTAFFFPKRLFSFAVQHTYPRYLRFAGFFTSFYKSKFERESVQRHSFMTEKVMRCKHA